MADIKGPGCGHSACSQHYIDTGDAACLRDNPLVLLDEIGRSQLLGRAEDIGHVMDMVTALRDAGRAILADVDAPGHTVRSIRAESVAALRGALAPYGGAP